MIRRCVLFGLLFVLLSGCISQQVATTIQPDGAGTHVIQIGFSRQFLDFAQMGSQSSVNLDDLTDALTQQLDQLPPEWEAQADSWRSSDDQYEGSQVTLQFSDLAMLEEQLTSPELAEINALLNFKDVQIRREDDVIIFNAIVENSDQSSTLGNSSDFSSLGLSGVTPNASWEIKLPGKLEDWETQSNAAFDEATNTVKYTWQYPLGQPQTIELRSSLKAGTSQRTLLLIGSLVVAGILIMLLGLLINRRQQRKAVVGAGSSATQPLAPPVPSYQPRPPSYQPSDMPPAAGYQPRPPSYQPNDTPPTPAGYDEPRVQPTRALGGWLTDDQQNDQTDASIK